MTTYTYSPEAIDYAAYRKEWRATYKTLSAEIRKLKVERSELARAGKMHRASVAQTELHYRSAKAFSMMEALAEEKAAWKALLAEGHVARWPTLEAAE